MTNLLIEFNNPKSAISEAFRTLRTNLQFCSSAGNISSILFASTMPGEGKSTIVSNIAITFAQTSQKVLIVDCDLRNPKIHSLFNLANSSGLTNILIKGDSINDFILSSEIPNLSILPSGPIPPNPSELLGTNRMKRVLRYLENSFDVVLLDAPPVIPVTDAQILSSIVDGVVFITSYGEIEKKAIIKAKELLDKVDAKILGVVLNRIPRSSEMNYYSKSYYSGYYEEK